PVKVIALSKAAVGAVVIKILSPVPLLPSIPVQPLIVSVPPLREPPAKVKATVGAPVWRLMVELLDNVKKPKVCDVFVPKRVPPLKIIGGPLMTLSTSATIVPLLSLIGPVKVTGALKVRVLAPFLVSTPEPIKPPLCPKRTGKPP